MNNDYNEKFIEWCSYPGADEHINTVISLLEKDINLEYEAKYTNKYSSFGPVGETGLMRAIRANNIELIKLLIEKGVDVNHARPSDKLTPLMLSAYYHMIGKDTIFGEVEVNLNPYGDQVIKLLIDADADIDKNVKGIGDVITYWRGDTEHSEVFKYLLENKKDFNAITSDGSNCLISLIKDVDLETFKKLHRKGADIHLVNKYNHNALMNAAIQGRSDIVMYLIENDAEMNLVSNHNGKNLLEILEDRKMTDIVELVKKYPSYYKLNNDLKNNKNKSNNKI